MPVRMSPTTIWTEDGVASAVAAASKNALTTAGDLMTASAPSTVDRIAAGAVGTVLVGKGAGVKPAFESVGGLGLDILDVVLAAASPGAGVDTTTITADLKELSGAPSARVGMFRIIASVVQFGGMAALQGHVTWSLATKGSIMATGGGWAVVQTDASGQFACTITNASHETVWFAAASIDGGCSVTTMGVVVRGCSPISVAWAP